MSWIFNCSCSSSNIVVDVVAVVVVVVVAIIVSAVNVRGVYIRLVTM